MSIMRALVEQRMPDAIKESLRSSRSKLISTSEISEQTSPKIRIKNQTNQMNKEKNIFEPLPPPPDPTLFIHAGTSGIRHLLPIHLTESDCNDDDLFSRTISRLRSHTPSTDLCSTIDMIRNVCLSIQTLEHFDISYNDLENLPNDICLLIHLQTLNCSHNQLTNITDLCQQLKELTELDLSFNKFKRLPNVIYTFKYLHRLNCEHNLIKIIDGDLLNLKHLKFLVLDNNQIQSLDNIDFSQLKRLEYMHAAHNRINKFPLNLHRLTHLKNINLSHNNLTSFPVALLLINTLDALNLSHNSISKLSPLSNIYKRSSLMFSIDLSFNQLTKLNDYLIFISQKLDLSHNKIQTIPLTFLRKLNYEIITNRELKLYNNPLIQPELPSEIFINETSNTLDTLQIIYNSFEEQLMNESIQQGFKICITGSKKTGKTSLAYCLEDYMPLIPDDQDERIFNILQYPFSIERTEDQSSVKPVEAPKVKSPRLDIDLAKRKKPSSAPPRQLMPTTLRPTSILQPPPVPLEPSRTLPLSIYDFNGSKEYYPHLSPFIDTKAVHLICIHTDEFVQTTPTDIEQIFEKNFDLKPYPMIKQLFEILQLLCEKATETNGIIIIPIATFIDLYDKKPQQDRNDALQKINKFFKCYLQVRIDRIQYEMQRIHSLQTISSSLSDRLRSYDALLNINIQIELCQPVSCTTYQGIVELNRTIQHCILTQKTVFPNIDRTVPILWADANRDIELLADKLPIPYLLWENLSAYIIKKHGLPNLINDITMSLHDEGKILVVNEIGTSDRIVFLRPLWLGDLLSSLFQADSPSESSYSSYRKEYYQYGRLHSDLLRSFWTYFLHQKEYFYQLWLDLMRFLLIAYPKLSKKQLVNLLNSKDKNEIKFDYAIVPFYLPLITSNQYDEETKFFYKQNKTHVHVSYRSLMLPSGFFHRYSVSAMFKLDINYLKHWNNLILGEYEEKKVRFIIETDHQTYINCICGTNINEQPFDNIWNTLMLLLNHFEEMFRILAPNNQFTRCVQCPFCKEYSFMGEWTTPRELQSLKTKTCIKCGKNVDTNYLIQPNESKRRNEELLKKIREQNAKNLKTKSSETTSDTTPVLIPPV